MKLKNFFEILGFRRKAKRYGYTVKEFNLPGIGTIRYAQWNHPFEHPKTVTADAVNCYRELISEGDFCVDIGAHTGDSTIPIALAAGPSGSVLAMEPNHYVFPILQKNARQNQDLMNIVPFFAAATESQGESFFEYSDPGFCNGGCHKGINIFKHAHAYKLSVFGVNLEEELRSDYAHFLPKLKFIKTDAEGYDLYILQSIAGILSEYKPLIKSEVFKKTTPDYRRELYTFLSGLGYSLFKVEKEPCWKGESLTPDNLCQWEHYDIFAEPTRASEGKP